MQGCQETEGTGTTARNYGFYSTRLEYQDHGKFITRPADGRFTAFVLVFSSSFSSLVRFSFDPTMFKQPPVSSLVQSCTQTLDPPHFRGQLGSDSTDLNQRPGLHKASKPSRVLSDFTSQKSFEDLMAPPRKLKSPPIQPITSHRRTHTLSTLSETKESHPISIVSAIDAIVMPTSKVKIPKISIGTSPTPRIKPVSFESTPGSVCRSAIIRRQDNLIFIQSGDDAKEDQASYSPSDTSFLRLPRPKTTPSFPTRESSSEAMRQHFVEVRRVRKMTQVGISVRGWRQKF